MAVFDIDYGLLVKQLLPVRLRKAVHKAWLQVLVSQVVYLYGLFTTNRTANLYRLAHSGQVCYLEAVLNDVFDPEARTITIADGIFHDPTFLYEADELKPAFIDLVSEVGTSVIPAPDPVPLYSDDETYLLGICFVVRVPTVVAGYTVYNIRRLRALVDLYRLPGRNNYSVQIV